MPSQNRIVRFARAVRTRLASLRTGRLSCLHPRSSSILTVDQAHHPTTNIDEKICDDVVPPIRRSDVTYLVGSAATDIASTPVDYTSTPMIRQRYNSTYDSSINSGWISSTTIPEYGTEIEWEDTYLVFQNIINPPSGWLNPRSDAYTDEADPKESTGNFDMSHAGRMLPPPEGFKDDPIKTIRTVRLSTDSSVSRGSQRRYSSEFDTKHGNQIVKEAGDNEIQFEICV